jgi:GxxExxY protein
VIHEELSRDIIGAATVVLNKLKPGLDEKVYERAIIIELERRGHVTARVMSSEVETSLDSNYSSMPRDYNFWIYIVTNKNHSVFTLA